MTAEALNLISSTSYVFKVWDEMISSALQSWELRRVVADLAIAGHDDAQTVFEDNSQLLAADILYNYDTQLLAEREMRRRMKVMLEDGYFQWREAGWE